MDSIPKFLASILTVIIGILFCISFIISSTVVNSARTYHASIIDEIEASNYDEITIQKNIKAAEEDGYSLIIEAVSGAVNETHTMYKVTLSYGLNAPIFGQSHTGTLTGYALSGTHLVEPSIEIPEDPVTGDVFIYNDYEYRYNMYYVGGETWYEKEEQNGWCARVLDDSKTSYNRPLSMIGDTPVVSLTATYYGCENLLEAPKIPETIVYMYRTYQDCVSMSDDVVIPSSVRSLGSAFYGCASENFVEAPTIPEGVVDMTHAFTDCVNLVTPPKIPSTVELLSSAFYGCESMDEMPDLEDADSLEGMSSAFVGCISLPSDLSDFEIPYTVTAGYKMFMDCTQLVTAPEIPNDLTDIRSIFEGCTSLTGTVYVHSDPYERYCEDAFKDTVKSIIIDGTCSDETKEYLVASANNNNVELPPEPEEEGSGEAA